MTEQAEELRTYMRKLLERNPLRVSEVLALSAGWNNDTPRFGIQSLEEAAVLLKRLVDLDWFVEQARRADVQAAAKYRSLLVEFLADFDRRAAAKQQSESPPSQPAAETTSEAEA